MAVKIGPKEARNRELREMRSSGKRGTAAGTAATDKIEAKPAEPAQPEPKAPKETEVKKPKKAPKPKAKKAAAKPKTAGTPAKDVADFICRDGGASMDELVKKFGIEAHPMRAKIHYARHTLGYAIETKDGRYVGTAPKVA